MDNLPLQKSNIIKILGIESLSSDKKTEILDNATTLIEMRSLERILDNLDNENIKKFQEILESENEDKIYDFLKKNDLDLIKISEEETKKVKQELEEASKEV